MSYWLRHPQSCPSVFFSSSKLAYTEQRNKLSPTIVEALQILKFSFKQYWLSFIPDLVAYESDYTISGPAALRGIEQLIEAAAYDELEWLFLNDE